MLSVADIHRNLAGIRQQFSRYLDFASDAALMVDNAELGCSPLRWIEFFARPVGRHFTVQPADAARHVLGALPRPAASPLLS